MIHLYASGNTHFDPVWLWRWDEAMASLRATFRSALERMKEDPDFTYAFSAPAVLRWIADTDPEMLEEIRHYVRLGRWEIGEGWYLQADAYGACGESYVRQGLYGQLWLWEQFGQISRTCYSIDSFGHPDTLPALLRGVGIENIVFCRPEEPMLSLPAPLFTWVGRDGSEVLAYRVGGEECGAYAPEMQSALYKMLPHLKEHDCDRLLVYGVTDHGGAPTKECLAFLHRFAREAEEKNKPYRLVFSTVERFFAAQKGKPLPRYDRELAVRYIGPSANYAPVKQDNRRAENAVLAAETAAVLEHLALGRPMPVASLRQIWEDVLFNQFHDILGGACIRDAYTDARDLHGRAAANAAGLLHPALQRICRSIRTPGQNGDTEWNLCLFNLTGKTGEREIVADAQWAWEFPWYRGGIQLEDAEGNVIPAQLLHSDAVVPGFRSRFAFRADLPAYGWRTLRIRKTGTEDTPLPHPGAPETPLSCFGYTVSFGPNGGICLLEQDGRVLSRDLFRPFVQQDICDTWGFNKTVYEDAHLPLTLTGTEITEEGPVRLTVKQTLRYDASTLELYLTFRPDGVACRARALWAEYGQTLRLSFTVPGATRTVAAEPAGSTEREASPYERPHSGWLALFGEDGGATLCSDSTFAYHFDGQQVALTVLRNCIFGDLRTEPLNPHGDFAYMGQGETVAEASVSFFRAPFRVQDAEEQYALYAARPVVVLEANHPGILPPAASFLSLTGEGLFPMALKPAQDGRGLIFRLRRAGGDGTGVLRFAGRTYSLRVRENGLCTLRLFDGKAEECDLLEGMCRGTDGAEM